MPILKKKKMDKPDPRENLIVSDRTFGIEIEAGNIDRKVLDNIQNVIGNFVHARGDSSVKAPNGVEFVTDVLQGTGGAKKVIKMCDALKKYNYITDDPSCGMHVHLDGKEFLNSENVVLVEPDGLDGFLADRANDIKKMTFVDGRIAGYLEHTKRPTPKGFIRFIKEYRHGEPKKDIKLVDFYVHNDPTYVRKRRHALDNGKTYSIEEYCVVDIDDLTIAEAICSKERKHLKELMQDDLNNKDALVRLEASQLYKEKSSMIYEKFEYKLSRLMKPKDGKYVAIINNRVPLERVKALMYFYTAFNDIIQGMVAPSRRIGNAYCMPIADFFELEKIEGLKTYDEFESLWYKEGDPAKIQGYKGQHYNDSRYLDVNLHSLFNRTNTVEFRLHGSTKDPVQILMWTALHQHIVDKIAQDEITVELVKGSVDNAENVEQKFHAMTEVADLPNHLSEYVKRLLNHFSNLKLN